MPRATRCHPRPNCFPLPRSNLRLRRLLCGKAAPFRCGRPSISLISAASPDSSGLAALMRRKFLRWAGKAEPFRGAGGEAHRQTARSSAKLDSLDRMPPATRADGPHGASRPHGGTEFRTESLPRIKEFSRARGHNRHQFLAALARLAV